MSENNIQERLPRLQLQNGRMVWLMGRSTGNRSALPVGHLNPILHAALRYGVGHFNPILATADPPKGSIPPLLVQKLTCETSVGTNCGIFMLGQCREHWQKITGLKIISNYYRTSWNEHILKSYNYSMWM